MYTFPGHGTFSSNGRSLEFVTITNEKGQCYSPTYGKEEPCPPFPFPIDASKYKPTTSGVDFKKVFTDRE